MKFKIEGITHDAELESFYMDWMQFTVEENSILGGERRLSSAQKLAIDLFCEKDEDYAEKATFEEELTVGTIAVAQMEFEALSRGRQRALARAFQRPPA